MLGQTRARLRDCAHDQTSLECDSSHSWRAGPGGTTLISVRPDEVRAIRYKLKQTQADFAVMIGVSVATLQSWEAGRHRPDGPAEALLRIADKNPKTVLKILGRA